MLVYALMMVIANVFIREASPRIGAWQMTFVRFAIGVLAMAPALARAGAGALRTERLGGHFGRSMVMVVGTLCGFYGFSHLPLADAGGLFYTRPIFVTLLAAVLLGESLRRKSIVALVGAFFGMLVILRPGQGELNIVLWVPLAGAALLAAAAVQTKQLLRTERPNTVLFYANAFGAAICAVFALHTWVDPTPREWLMLGLIGGFGIIAQWAMVRAYAVGQPSAIAPFEYAQFVFAPLLGLLVFAEPLLPWTTLGIAMIVASGVYLAREPAATIRASPDGGRGTNGKSA
jgi:drug/metabolite transporter (DMT)-like permease